jgi:hypothetical protein
MFVKQLTCVICVYLQIRGKEHRQNRTFFGNIDNRSDQVWGCVYAYLHNAIWRHDVVSNVAAEYLHRNLVLYCFIEFITFYFTECRDEAPASASASGPPRVWFPALGPQFQAQKSIDRLRLFSITPVGGSFCLPRHPPPTLWAISRPRNCRHSRPSASKIRWLRLPVCRTVLHFMYFSI